MPLPSITLSLLSLTIKAKPNTIQTHSLRSYFLLLFSLSLFTNTTHKLLPFSFFILIAIMFQRFKSPLILSIFHFLILLPGVRSLPALTNPVPATIQSFLPPPATIPAFPEQSDATGCPLDLPDELFRGIKSSCKGKPKSGQPHRSRCCPVLAAWLYSAYAGTALGREGRTLQTTSYNDLPLLPDDSETCVDSLQKGLRNKGIELVKPNETCDVVYCYCGIRLHPLSCPAAFSVSPESGKLVGDHSVKRLERNCLRSGGNGFAGLSGCSNCLNTLYLLSKDKTRNTSNSDDRTRKMQRRDCELMGLTWLLSKNRSAYIHMVSAVLRAIMMSSDGSHPQSCSLNSDGMPLALDSSEFKDQSSSPYLHSPRRLCIALLCLLYTSIIALLTSY